MSSGNDNQKEKQPMAGEATKSSPSMKGLDQEPEEMKTPEAQEVDFEEALAEEEAAKQASAKPEKEEKPEDPLDILEPRSEPLAVEIGPEGASRIYMQRPLALVGKLEFFGLIGEVVDKAISGDDGLKIGHLFSGPQSRSGAISLSDFQDAETFLQAIGKLVTYMPDFFQKCACIWLSVPDHERAWAKEAMSLHKDDGGLSDEMGLQMIETFIDQNWDDLDDFFRNKLPNLRKRVEAKMDNEDTSTPSSKQSSPTAPSMGSPSTN